VRFASGPPTRWAVELIDGSIVDLWADGYSRDDDHYTFSSLFDLDDSEEVPSDAIVVGESPSNPRRFDLAVAIFPKAAVRLPDGDEEWPAIYSR
jgi:hypothetical protein